MNKQVKSLLLFLAGAIVIGLAVFFLLKTEHSTENTQTAQINEPKQNLNLQGEEDPIMSNENIAQANQKLTVEQKLSVQAPTQQIDATKSYSAVIKTNLGDITLSLDAKNRPLTVNNFVYLAQLGFYDDVIFHRVIKNFMIQGGDPLGRGNGGPAYKFSDELEGDNLNSKGTVAMANSGSNTNGSQFFINLVDNNYLDTKHTVFGKVTAGMEIVDGIGASQVDINNRPVSPITISSIEIVEE